MLWDRRVLWMIGVMTALGGAGTAVALWMEPGDYPFAMKVVAGTWVIALLVYLAFAIQRAAGRQSHTRDLTEETPRNMDAPHVFVSYVRENEEELPRRVPRELLPSHNWGSGGGPGAEDPLHTGDSKRAGPSWVCRPARWRSRAPTHRRGATPLTRHRRQTRFAGWCSNRRPRCARVGRRAVHPSGRAMSRWANPRHHWRSRGPRSRPTPPDRFERESSDWYSGRRLHPQRPQVGTRAFRRE